jgi:hypothetical protein
MLEYLSGECSGKGKLFSYKYSNILKPSHSSHLPAYEDGTECSETSAYKIQPPRNCPEERIQQKKMFPVIPFSPTSVTFSLLVPNICISHPFSDTQNSCSSLRQTKFYKRTKHLHSKGTTYRPHTNKHLLLKNVTQNWSQIRSSD